MKLAISNIAWLPEQAEAVVDLILAHGIRHIEVAPTTIDPNPTRLSSDTLLRFRRFWDTRGVSIVALQALLYGRADLTLFESPGKRQEALDYLTRMMDIAVTLGAGVLVFGSPGNRRTGNTPSEEVEEIATEFFSELGSRAECRGLHFCIEPNPEAYGCDYLNTSTDVMALLRHVMSPGLGLHLDSAAMLLGGEQPEVITTMEPLELRHFHISEPQLGPIGAGPVRVPHDEFAAALRFIGYDRFVSIEMRPDQQNPESNLERIDLALGYAAEHYQNSDR